MEQYVTGKIFNTKCPPNSNSFYFAMDCSSKGLQTTVMMGIWIWYQLNNSYYLNDGLLVCNLTHIKRGQQMLKIHLK